MRHAGNKALKNLKGLLEKIRKQKHLKEKKLQKSKLYRALKN